MTMSPEFQHHASEIILVSLELCASILKSTRRPNRNPLLTSIWSEQETGDLINYLYQRRGEISEGSFPAGAFSDLAAYLNKRHPRSHRSRNLVLSRFALLKDAIAIIDGYHAVHGGGLDPSIVFVADTKVFNTYLLTISDRDREVLEKYRHQPFPHYGKFKAILRCIESTSLTPRSRREAPAVERHPAIIQLPDQLPRSSTSDPFIHTDSAASSAATTSFFPAPSATSSFPSTACLQVDHQSFPGSWAGDYQQAAPSLSYHSSPTRTSAIQQSGPPLPAVSFDALESQSVHAWDSADDQQQAVSALPVSHLSRDPALLSLAPGGIHHSIPSLPSGLQSIAMPSRASSKRRHVDDARAAISSSKSTSIEQPTALSSASAKRRRVDEAAIFDDQSSCLETTPMATVAKILDHVEIFAKIIRQPPPPPSLLMFCISAAVKATNGLSRNRFLSDEQKVLLRQHFCRNPVEAASLPEDDALLNNIFQDMIKRPDLL